MAYAYILEMYGPKDNVWPTPLEHPFTSLAEEWTWTRLMVFLYFYHVANIGLTHKRYMNVTIYMLMTSTPYVWYPSTPILPMTFCVLSFFSTLLVFHILSKRQKYWEKGKKERRIGKRISYPAFLRYFLTDYFFKKKLYHLFEKYKKL